VRSLRIKIVPRPADQDLSQCAQLLHGHRHMAFGTVELIGKVCADGDEGVEDLAGVGEQGRCVDIVAHSDELIEWDATTPTGRLGACGGIRLRLGAGSGRVGRCRANQRKLWGLFHDVAPWSEHSLQLRLPNRPLVGSGRGA
jgi:hypothetical protein